MNLKELGFRINTRYTNIDNDFNNFRFGGLHHKRCSNKYMTMNRVSDDETRIVVKVANNHLFQTAYGYGLILDSKHVIWLKNWAVSENWFGNEVMLTKEYFIPKEYDKINKDEFMVENEKELKWETWLELAKTQDAKVEYYTDEDGEKYYTRNEVKWAI